MRVITGSARGRKLQTLPGEGVTRPTTESVKEALFSMIQFEIEGKRVLDLFAGTGQLGIEALSRGARVCTFVEKDKRAMQIVQENVRHCGFDEQSNFIMSEAVSFLSRNGSYDIVFLDPPYDNKLINRCLSLLNSSMSEDGIIICETLRNEVLPDTVDGFVLYRERNYGKTKLTLYRHPGKE